ncbi:MAG: hypothetical protein ACRD1T_01520, partial [Acidimicrobiia bacterium]
MSRPRTSGDQGSRALPLRPPQLINRRVKDAAEEIERLVAAGCPVCEPAVQIVKPEACPVTAQLVSGTATLGS